MENRKEKKTEIEGNKALKSTEVKQQNNMKKEKTTNQKEKNISTKKKTKNEQSPFHDHKVHANIARNPAKQ